MEIISRFVQRERFTLTMVTYLLQSISQFQSQKHRLSSVIFLPQLVVPQEDEVVQELKIRATHEHCRRRQCYTSLTTYFLNIYPQDIHQGGFHTSDKQEHGRGGGGWLHMEVSWCILVYCSWRKPLNVFSAVINGATSQFILLRCLHTSSMAHLIGPSLSKF